MIRNAVLVKIMRSLIHDGICYMFNSFINRNRVNLSTNLPIWKTLVDRGLKDISPLIFTCSRLTTEVLEQGVKYV